MLEKPRISSAYSLEYDDLLAAYLAECEGKLIVSEKERQAALQKMDHEIDFERFYFSVDLHDNKIKHRNGIRKWLGYPDGDFSMRDYSEIIHPAHAAVQDFYSLSFLNLIKSNQFRVRVMQPVCISIISVKHKSGSYILCRRECMPLQVTDQGKLTEYLYGFSIIKYYEGEHYHSRISANNHEGVFMNSQLNALVGHQFARSRVFSTQELRIIKRYAAHTNSTSDAISAAFRIKKSTVDTFNKRIIQKAEAFAKIRFKTAKDAAEYFRHTGLI